MSTDERPAASTDERDALIDPASKTQPAEGGRDEAMDPADAETGEAREPQRTMPDPEVPEA
jgi:hypothetical protein